MKTSLSVISNRTK